MSDQSRGLRGGIRHRPARRGKPEKTTSNESGKRTGAWIKHRLNSGQELVIGGYVPGTIVADWIASSLATTPIVIFLISTVSEGLEEEIGGNVFVSRGRTTSISSGCYSCGFCTEAHPNSDSL
jgi:hypothetical protein